MANEVEVAGLFDWKSMFEGRMGTGMQFLSALSELIDNAFDARASVIHIKFDSRRFEIDDNGIGSSSLEPFFGYGIHKAHAKGRRDALGVWGVGGTHAILYISEKLSVTVEIETRTEATRTILTTTWQLLAAKFNATEKVVARQEPNTGRPGTRITLTGDVKKTPNNRDLDALAEKLSFRYSKALAEGAKIIITRGDPTKGGRSVVLPGVEPPQLADVVSETFEVNGKRVAIMVGVVPQGASNARPGLHYRYSYRVLKESSAEGCGNYSTQRIFGFVDLLGDWRLDLHKDGTTDRDARVLHAEVFRRIEPILKQAQGQLMLAESAALLNVVNRRLNEAIQKTKKARRGKGTTKGTRRPTGAGSAHGNAAVKQPGEAMPGEPNAVGVHVGFADLEGDAIGDFKGNTIRLNTKLEDVRRYRADVNSDAIFVAAMFVYMLSVKHDGSLGMLEVQAALDGVGATLSGGARLDGKVLSQPTAAE